MSYSADSAALGARWARLSILFRVPYVVIESDPDIVETLRSRGILCLFGDAIHERRRPITGSPEMELVFTSYIERLNATTRLHVKRLSRLTLAFSKKLENFEAAVGHFAYYNFVKRHNSLRCNPAMAARVERDFWTVGDLVEATV